MISRTRRIIDGLLLIVVMFVILFMGNCYLIVKDSKDCNVLLEYKRTVVTVFGEVGAEAMGSGVLISKDGWVLTAGHCVRDVNDLRVTLSNGESYEVSEYLVPEDSNVDFGLIKLPIVVKNFRPLGNSNGVSGWIYNIGNAGGIWEGKFTFGNVYKSNLKRRFLGNTQFILSEMQIQHGCSGGGVYKYSRLIGIVSMKAGESGCLIVPSNVIKKLRNSCKPHKIGEQSSSSNISIS
jgi:serine protease Do